jgi:hypothetical protein
MKRILTLSLIVLGAASLNAQTSNPYIKDENARASAFRKHMSMMLDRQQADAKMKTTVLTERIIARSGYELNTSTVPNIFDSIHYVYSGTNGSKFNFNYMDFDNFFAPDFGPFDYPYDMSTLPVMADSVRFWSKDSATGPLVLDELTTAAFNTNKKLTSSGDYYFDMGMPDGADVYYHSYDAQGRLTTITGLYDGGSGLDSSNKIVFYYNAQGQHYRDSVYEYDNGQWKTAGVINYAFDAAGNITNVTIDVMILSTWTTVAKYDNTFYSNNKLQISTEYYFSGVSLLPGTKDSFGYANNSVFATFQEEYAINNGLWEPQFRSTKHLNAQSLPDTILFEVYNNNNWMAAQRDVYTYTSYGNPQEKHVYNANGTTWDLSIIRHFYYEIYNDPNNVQDLAEQERMNVYPNPVSNELNISWANGSGKKVSLELINATGQRTFTKSVTWKEDHETISVQQLAPGMYWLAVKDEAGNVVFRQGVVKQ